MSKLPFNVLANRHNDWDRVPREPVTAAITTFLVSAGASVFVASTIAYIGVSLVTSWALSALTPKPKFSGGDLTSRGLLVNQKDAIAPHDFVYGEVRKGGTISYYETTGSNNKFLHQIITLAGHEVDAIGNIYLNDEVVTILEDEVRYEIEEITAPTDTPLNPAAVRLIKNHTISVPVSYNFYNSGQEINSTQLQELIDNAIEYSVVETSRFLPPLSPFFPVGITVVNKVGNGFVSSAPWSGKVRIKKFLGTESQVADPDLVAESNQIDANFRGRGIAYLYVRYEYDQEVFANGLPLVTAVVRGKKVYDPRTTSTAYSNNAALCVRDYITSAYGLSDSQIDDTVFSAAANICDENVSLSGGGTEKKYTINGVIRASENHGDTLQNMMTACAGSLFWGAGNWKLVVGDYIAPVKTLTLDDLRGPISLATRVNVRDQFNGVQGTFSDASQRWITTDYPAITSSAFQSEDGGEESLLDLPLFYTTSSATAQRLAKVTLFRGREQMTMTADFGLNAFDVEVGEIIALTNPRYGWDEKEFEVVSWSFGSSDAGDLRVTLTLRETSEAAFDWNAEESALIQNNTNLPSAFTTAAVGISLGGELRVANQQVVGVLIVDVTADSPFVDRFEVQFKRSEEINWITLGQATGNRFEAVGISDGYFDIRARSVNVFGARGPFNTILGFYATLFETPPEDVTNFSANVVGNTLHLSWTPVGDLDLSHYKVRYSNETTGAEYQKAVDILKRVSRPANSITVPAQTGTYFIKAVDKLGNVSLNPATIVVTTNVADIDGLNVVETSVQHPDFTGEKTDVVRQTDLVGNYITLDTSLTFDEVSGNFDEAGGLFDGGGSDTPLASGGIYYFDDYIDLGQKYLSRVLTDLIVDFLDYGDTFDSSSGLFDAREGLFDGDPTAFDTTSVRTQVSFTDDDPSGSPTWSDWRDFIVGDINARAIRFRVILESSNNSNAPAVRELTAIVDMPDRVEADDDITYTGSQIVTFPAAFRVPPAIGIAATLADGDRYVISSKSRTGFTITTFTGASVSTNPTTIDYVAKGYGKELA